MYFFHVASGSGTVRDEEGSDLSDLDAAREEAIKDARILMSDAILDGRDISQRSVEICGEGGKLLLVVPFRMALSPCD
jgi:hypothetical protein